MHKVHPYAAPVCRRWLRGQLRHAPAGLTRVRSSKGLFSAALRCMHASADVLPAGTGRRDGSGLRLAARQSGAAGEGQRICRGLQDSNSRGHHPERGAPGPASRLPPVSGYTPAWRVTAAWHSCCPTKCEGTGGQGLLSVSNPRGLLDTMGQHVHGQPHHMDSPTLSPSCKLAVDG